MLCLISALEREMTPVIAKYSKKVNVHGFLKVHECEAFGKTFLVCTSGMGKCFAAMSIVALKEAGYQIDKVINLGVGGSLDEEKAGLLSCLIGSTYIQHDMDSSPLGDPKGMISGINVTVFRGDKALIEEVESACAKLGFKSACGQICSGDQFIVEDKDKERIISTFPGTISIDMESAAYAQSAYVYNVPFVAARFISDLGHAGEYEKYFGDGQRKIEAIVDELVKDIA